MSTIYTKDFCVCPWCEARTDSALDHLYDKPGGTFGPWYCSECRAPFSGRINAPHDVTLWKEQNADSAFSPSVALIRFDGKDGPTFFVMKHDRCRAAPDETDEQNQEHQRYFFEEHSCPTNWLRECVAVIQNGNTDPHGFLTFVRAVDVGNDFDEDDDEQWAILFPEAFASPIIDGDVCPR